MHRQLEVYWSRALVHTSVDYAKLVTCSHKYYSYRISLLLLSLFMCPLLFKCCSVVIYVHTSSVPTPMLQGVHSLQMPLTFDLLAAEPSTKAVWKCTAVVSGRLSVTTPGTLQKQRWSVGSWGMDMPYWQYRVLPLARDQAGSGIECGTAMEERPAWMVAAALVPSAPTLKMHL